MKKYTTMKLLLTFIHYWITIVQSIYAYQINYKENKNMSNGRKGELLFKQIMENKGYTVLDVTENKDYQFIDVDFLVTSPTGEKRAIEVKWDYKIHKTKNMFLELANKNSIQWGCEGWWLHCKADYLAYGDAISGKFYIFPLLDLRERVEHLPQNIVSCGTDSVANLVPLSCVKDIYVVEEGLL